MVIGDNVSYVISSTGKVHAVEDPYYSSISLAPREEFPPAPQQPLPPIPLTTTVRYEQETEIKEANAESQDSRFQETSLQDSKAQVSETRDREAKGGETQEIESQGSEVKIKAPCDPIYDDCQ